jgi:hypothetical protein
LKKPALRRVRSRLTYSNIIATLALFIALSGASYAAVKLPKNSVTTKTIKRSAVTSPKIKNKTITGADVKSDTLTGKQINESTLAIPSAAFAASAGTATDTFSIVKTARASASNAVENDARAAATEIPLASHGAVSLYAKCYSTTAGTPQTHFEVFARTTANGAIFAGDSTYDYLYGDPNTLKTTTPEDERQVTDDETDSGPDDVDDDYGTNVSLLGPDAKGLFFSTENYARIGAAVDPTPLLPNDDSCLFHVTGRYVG